MTLFALPLRTSVPIPAWNSTRVTLLGDAIHAMSPASGSGACTTLRDAAALASALTDTIDGDLHTALRDYEQHMIDYGSPPCGPEQPTENDSSARNPYHRDNFSSTSTKIVRLSSSGTARIGQ